MSYAQWRNTHTPFFVHLIIILIFKESILLCYSTYICSFCSCLSTTLSKSHLHLTVY
jgi:hypothetical protein